MVNLIETAILLKQAHDCGDRENNVDDKEDLVAHSAYEYRGENQQETHSYRGLFFH